MSYIDEYNKAMKSQPFDDINFKIDSRYVDFGVGYTKEKGTSIGLTIDLNTIGQPTDTDLKKLQYELEKEKLALQKQLMLLQASGFNFNSKPSENAQPVPSTHGGKAFLEE